MRTKVGTLVLLSLAAGTLSAQQLPDVTVTANRTAVPTQAPAAVTVITGEDLRKRGITTLQEALKEVPGFTIVQPGSYGSVANLFVRGGESDYTKFLLDGVPLNQPGGAINLANMTTDNIDRIEVVRGPASVLYGSDAVSGTVQIFTRRGVKPAQSVELRGGTFGTAELRGGLETKGVTATFGTMSTDGTYDFNSEYRNTTAAVSGETGKVALTLRYTDAKGHFPTNGAGVPTDSNQFSSEQSTVVGLHYSPTKKLGIRFYGQRQGTVANNASDFPTDTVGFAFAYNWVGHTTRLGTEAKADWAVGTGNLTAGAGFESEQDHSETTTSSNFGDGVFTDSDSYSRNRNTSSLFTQLVLPATSNWELQGGARLDYNSAYNANVTWRVGSSYQLKSFRFYGAVGTAFKEPTFSELSARSQFEIGNPDLVPEHALSYELGVEKPIASWGRVAVSLFDQRFTDLIQYVSAAPGEPTYQNLGAATSKGVEATFKIRASQSLDFAVHWVWLKTEVTDTGAASTPTFAQGEPLLRRPASSGGVLADYTKGRFVITASGNYTGEREDVDFTDFPGERVVLEDHFLIDLTARVQVLDNLSGSVRVENLVDTEWTPIVGVPGRGRTVLVGLHWNH